MSTLKVGTIQNAAGVEVYTAKAWVNFNGTGTVAIRAAGNVSSITDNGTGVYTVNLTTALSDTNYAFIATSRADPTYYSVISPQTTATKTTSALQVHCLILTTGSMLDSSEIDVAIFR